MFFLDTAAIRGKRNSCQILYLLKLNISVKGRIHKTYQRISDRQLDESLL